MLIEFCKRRKTHLTRIFCSKMTATKKLPQRHAKNHLIDREIHKTEREIWNKEFLEAHNEYRRLHGCPDLKMNWTLNVFAQQWADHLLATKKIIKRPKSPYGENLYCNLQTQADFKGSRPVDMWYQEIDKHNFESDELTMETAHFTQVIWKNTRELGVGVVRRDNITIVVAVYHPSGNFKSKLRENVPPILSTKVSETKWHTPTPSLNDEFLFQTETKPICNNKMKKTNAERKISLKSLVKQKQQAIGNHAARLKSAGFENQLSNFEYSEEKLMTESQNHYEIPYCGTVKLNLPDIDDELFEAEFLHTINELRKLHGAKPLKLNSQLCQSAQQWAQHLASGHTFRHKNHTDYGQNIYRTLRMTHLSAKDAVLQWYSQQRNYDIATGSNPGYCYVRHFTQLIWRSTKEVGYGVAKEDKMIFIVANFGPAGNLENQYMHNVWPLIKSNLDSYGVEKEGIPHLHKFRKDFLHTHNELRIKHGAAPLRLNDTLNYYAQKKAEHLAKDLSGDFKLNYNFGESIFYTNHTETRGQDPVMFWYNETEKFNFLDMHYDRKYQHFIQIIWKATNCVGVGVAKEDDITYVVAYYAPRGNVPGAFKANVQAARRNVLAEHFKAKTQAVEQQSHPIKDTPQCKLLAESCKLKQQSKLFEWECLLQHNILRQKHNANPLRLTRRMCKCAKKRLKEVVLKDVEKQLSKYKIQHELHYNTNESQDFEYGFSVFVTCNKNDDANTVVESWYQEQAQYDYQKPVEGQATCFTQLVWKDSRELGIAKMELNGKQFVLATYYPAGNRTSHYQANVEPPIKEKRATGILNMLSDMFSSFFGSNRSA